MVLLPWQAHTAAQSSAKASSKGCTSHVPMAEEADQPESKTNNSAPEGTVHHHSSLPPHLRNEDSKASQAWIRGLTTTLPILVQLLQFCSPPSSLLYRADDRGGLLGWKEPQLNPWLPYHSSRPSLISLLCSQSVSASS